MSFRGGIIPALLVALGCSAPAERGKVNAEALELAVQQRLDAEERYGSEIAEARARIRELENELVDLRARLGIAEVVAEDAKNEADARAADAERYQAGLDRAVGELNRVSQQQAVKTAASSAAFSVATARPARRTQQPRASVSYYSDPRLSVVDRSVVASGRLYNSAEVEASGELQLTLVRNGEALETKTQPFSVYGNSWGEWSENFNITPTPNAHYTVKARLVE